MNAIKLAALAAALVLTASTASSQEEKPAATLKPGDPAPKLQTGKFVQGEPVKEFKKGTAYIVEFWATWCGPCKVSIPHLNEIHNKFKDKGLVVIGQDVWEQDESQVEPFVKKMGDKMTYRVALDDKQGSDKGKMAETWMEAAGQNGIPAAFLIDKEGKVAWIGHPGELDDSTVQEVLDGKFDVKKAAAKSEEAKKQQQELMKLSRQLSSAMQEKDWTKAESTMADIEKLLPESQKKVLDGVRMQIFLSKDDLDNAAKMALSVSDSNKDNAMVQNQLAWKLATQNGLKGDALDTAAKIAARGNDIAEGKDPAVLDTLARLTFMQGKKDEAIKLETKAVGLANDDMKEQLQKTLDSYKDGKLPAVSE
jgi:thiol-disulfide isomerase/thioredoxin